MNMGGFGRSDDDAVERLSELSQNTPEDIAAMRASSRYSTECAIVVHPANVAERGAGLAGTTADVSEGGCRVVVGRPLRPGDVIVIAFDRNTLDIPDAFGQVVRCQMFQDDSFEAGIRFLRSIDPAALSNLDDEEAIDELI